jgi:nucleotide-binding universal stress UspA family protein
MFKKILVSLDGSKFSERSLKFASSEARKSDASIILLSVCTKGIDYIPAPPSGQAVYIPVELFVKEFSVRRNQIMLYLKTVAEKLAEEGLHVEPVVLEGLRADVPDIIVQYGEETGIDLIVMATHGRKGFLKLFWGSVADAVLKKSLIPVLLIKPERARYENSRKHHETDEETDKLFELGFSND